MKNLSCSTCTTIVVISFFLLVIIPRYVYAGAIVTNESIDQYDFFGNSAPSVIDSEWGRYSVTLTGGSVVEYLNLVGKDTGGTEHWLVRNMPILPEMTSLVTLTTGFDLSPFITGRGDDLSELMFGTSISETASLSSIPPSVSFSPVTVGDTLFDAEGKAGTGGPHIEPGTPESRGSLSFNGNNILHWKLNGNLSNVEQGIDECAPGAAANSLQWLKDDQGLKLTDTLDDRLDDLVGKMETNGIITPAEPFDDSNGNGQRDAGESFTDTNSNGKYDEEVIDGGTQDHKFITGKLEYLAENNLSENNPHVKVKFQDDDLGGANIIDPVSGKKAIAKGTTPTSDFIFKELNDDEDVEIGITYLTPAEPYEDTNNNNQYDIGEPFTDTDTNGKYDGERENGGHWVQAVGKFELFGLRSVWFIEDEVQGVDNDEPFVDANGNGKYDKGETFTDENGNGRWNDSGTKKIGWSRLNTRADGFLELYDYPGLNKIDIVVSESIVPEPPALGLLTLGLLSLFACSRRRFI